MVSRAGAADWELIAVWQRVDAVDSGVDAQGGDAVVTVRAGWRPDALIIVNSSRAILYASGGDDFAEAARREALKTRDVLQAARGAA